MKVLGFLILLGCSQNLFGQEKKFYFDTQQSTKGVDIKIDSENFFVVLGAVSAYTYPPPVLFFGIGDRVLKLDENLDLLLKDSFKYRTAHTGSFLKINSSDNIFVPFVRESFTQFCDSDSMSATTAFHVGYSALIQDNNGGYHSYLKSFNDEGYAEWPTILGLTVHEDSILMVFSKHIGCRNPVDDPYFYFQWMDLQGDIISLDSIKFFPFQPNQNNYLEIAENQFFKYDENEFFISCRNTETDEEYILITDYKGKILRSTYISKYYRPTLLNSKKGIIKYGSRTIISYDRDFNLIRTNSYSPDVIRSIADIEIMPNDSMLIVYRDNQTRDFVGLLDPEGKLIARREYKIDPSEGVEKLEGITAFGTDGYAVVGTKRRTEDLINAAVPPDQLFVFTDKLSNLETYTSSVNTVEAFKNQIEIFPNPSGSDWTFRAMETGKGKIYNLSGQLVKKFEHRNGSVTNISGEGFASGLYILSWRETKSGINQVLKIIKK